MMGLRKVTCGDMLSCSGLRDRGTHDLKYRAPGVSEGKWFDSSKRVKLSLRQ